MTLMTRMSIVLLAIGLFMIAFAVVIGFLRSAWRWLVAWWSPVTVIGGDVGGGLPHIDVADPGLGVVARPDVWLQVRQRAHDGTALEVLVPKEVKPLRRGRNAAIGDIVQIAVALAGQRVRFPQSFAGYGLIEYAAGRVFRIEWTPRLESILRDTVAGVRRVRAGEATHRTHANPALCRHCPVAHHCDERLL